MEKNDIFTFIAPNGVEVTAAVVSAIRCSSWQTLYICYSQNRLFAYFEQKETDSETGMDDICHFMGEVVVEYVVLPEYDRMLEDYQHQLDMADDYASREL